MLSEEKYQCQKKSTDISKYSTLKINIKYLLVILCKVSLTQLFWFLKYLNWLNILHRHFLLQNPGVNKQASKSSSFNIIQQFLSKLFNHRVLSDAQYKETLHLPTLIQTVSICYLLNKCATFCIKYFRAARLITSRNKICLLGYALRKKAIFKCTSFFVVL